ncbi:MAG: helix-turn-helix domain-containing protein [Solirubrobacteraceae bacterium]
MEKAWLASQLEAGRSFEEIGRELGRHPSTVSYWARKHGLASGHAARHAVRGAIERWRLERAIACGLSVREIADLTCRSTATVRHWLARHGLETPRTAGDARRSTPPPERTGSRCSPVRRTARPGT